MDGTAEKNKASVTHTGFLFQRSSDEGAAVLLFISEKETNLPKYADLPVFACSDVKASAHELLETLQSSISVGNLVPLCSPMGLFPLPNFGGNPLVSRPTGINYYHAYDPPIDSTSHFSWTKVTDALQAFNSHTWLLSPLLLQFLLWLHSPPVSRSFLSLCSPRTSANLSLGLQFPLYFAPGIQVYPIPSNTLPPFTSTNLILFGSSTSSSSSSLIVDPSPSTEAKDYFLALIQRYCKPLHYIFLTHHHQDHYEGLQYLECLFPDAQVIASEKTLNRITTRLRKTPVLNGHIIELPLTNEDKGEPLKLEVIDTEGHTDGHQALWEHNSRALVVGDHMVGFGSAVLDSVGGGDMKKYMETTRKMADMKPHLALPAHGAPIYTPIAQLEVYYKHRQDRENKILKAIEEGATTMEQILSAVYNDVPKNMWKVAMSNVILHIRKLQEENRLPESFPITQLNNKL